ncbi:MAG: TerC family protein, partial [Candidatus Rokuibacteriota bacterium]
MEWLSTDGLIALAALTAMEIVLGIDNIVFITILTDRLPPSQRSLGRRLGLGFALGTRI